MTQEQPSSERRSAALSSDRRLDEDPAADLSFARRDESAISGYGLPACVGAGAM